MHQNMVDVIRSKLNRVVPGLYPILDVFCRQLYGKSFGDVLSDREKVLEILKKFYGDTAPADIIANLIFSDDKLYQMTNTLKRGFRSILGRSAMRIVVYDEKGRQVEKAENILVPRPSGYDGILYVVYESASFAVVAKVLRIPGERETEDIVAVKTSKGLHIYEELPETLAEKLGIEKERAVPSKVRV